MNRPEPEDTLAALIGDAAVLALAVAIRVEQRLRNFRRAVRRAIGRGWERY